MWKYTAVVEADPERIFGVAFAGMTCLRSIKVVVLGPTETDDATGMLSIFNVNVEVDVAELLTTTLETMVVVVVFGTVYSVVLEVAAATRANAFGVAAIYKAPIMSKIDLSDIEPYALDVVMVKSGPLTVKPDTDVTVAPEEIVVEPSVGAEYPAAHFTPEV